MTRLQIRLAASLVVALAIAGCGSSSKSSTGTTSGTATVVSIPVATTDATIAGQVPAAIKSKGTLEVGTEAQYAPNEFVAPDGHTIIGMDPDLVTALAKVMGLKASFHNATFESIIPGIQAGRYDLGASSFTDTKEREKSVDFVTYFQAGISFYAKTASPVSVTSVGQLCGKTVALEKGTTEQEEAEKQNKECPKEGKPSVTVLSFPGQNPVNLAVASGRAELGMADSPVVEYQIEQAHGQFKLLCKCYGFAPYGLAVAKNSGLAEPMLAALKKLMAEGIYTKILTKWGIQSGAIAESEAKINGARG
jgi:polar amino acid transport system substrate-binding protein